MRTDCSNPQISFEGFEGRQVVGSFDGGAVTSNAGALLLREADRVIGLTRRVCGAIRDGRLQDAVVHVLPTLVAQRIYAIGLDYEDVNDHDELRHDPALALVSDTLEPKRSDVAVLAGKSTLQRFEQSAKTGSARYHKFDVDDAAMDQVFLDIYIAAHKQPPKKIKLDLDATDIPLHGDQEGRFFHGYYGNYCYLPLYVFAGKHLLLARLRRANIDAAAGAREDIARIVAYLRRYWPEVEICLRADSGFAREELMAWCEENRVDYVFGLARNKRLEGLIEEASAQAKAQFEATKAPARVFKELEYRTRKSWSRSRRVVAKAEQLEKGANPRFIVTSIAAEKIEDQELYEKVYCQRGEMENRIKECQLDLLADRASAMTMRSNQIRLWFSSLAYVLVHALRRLGLAGSSLEQATVGTIRLKLFKIGAVVTRSVRRIKFAFATACPLQDVFALCVRRLREIAADTPAAAA
jgi:Transposase DDE domain group 1